MAGLRAGKSLSPLPQQSPAPTANPASWLTASYSQEFLARQIAAHPNWRPFPAAEYRTAWDALLAQPLNQQRKVFLVKAAEGFLGKSWPALPATLYMEYARTGNRYDLWFTRGSAHNAPVVNGFEQKDGREYQATRVEFHDQASSQRLAMNLEKAYPAEAGIDSLRRELHFIRGPKAQVQIQDSWTLSRGPSNMRYFFYAAAPVEQLQPGRLAVHGRQRRLLFEYDPPGMAVRWEPVTVADETLRRNWGDRLYRIVFEYQEARASGAIHFRFRGE